MPCEAARELLRYQLVSDLEYPHLDVLQIHRADTFSDPDRKPYLVRLDEGLWKLFNTRDTIFLAKKLNCFRMGFLSNFGNFTSHASPS